MATQTLTPTTSTEDAGGRGPLDVEMEKRCYICGVAGFKELLATCIKCESAFIHPYCMKKVEFIVPDDWVCEDCDGSDEAPIVDEATVLVSRSLFSKGKKHLASPEKSCNGAEIPMKGVGDLTIMNHLPTLQPRGEKLSKGTLAGRKRRKKRHVQEHLPLAVLEPPLKQHSCVKSHVHADLEPVSTHGKKHLASPEKSCNGAEIHKKGVEDSTNMNRLATLQPRGEKLSKGTLAGRKRRKKRHVQEHSRVESHVHADAAEPILQLTLSNQIILHDPEHIKRYNNLKSRKICNTRYLDEELLDTLGLKEDIWWMAEQVGWTQFLAMKEPTYISLTQEFLSTVKTDFPRNGKVWLITFRLQNQDRQLTIEQFNSIFGFPTGGARTKPSEFRADDFWSEISDEQCFDPRIASPNSIYNPCFRVMLRFMAHTIFGRGRGNRSVVRSRELLHLWAMVHCHSLDTGKCLALHLQSVGKGTREIAIGGLITSIARHFNVDTEGLAQATGGNRIDLRICKMMKMVACQDGRYSLRFQKRDDLWPLPDPANTTILVRENWKRTFKRGMPHGQGNVGSSSGHEAQGPEPIASLICPL